MDAEEYKKSVALPSDYQEQKSCENCKFIEIIYGDSSCGDPDIFFCDFGQDYKSDDDDFQGSTCFFNDTKYKLWIEVREVKKCGVCGNHVKDPDS